MKNKILRAIGFFLVFCGVYSFCLMLVFPVEIFVKKIFPVILVAGGLGSLAALIIMISNESEADSMKCPACGREVDALIGRQNDPETKVCADCYVTEDIKKEQEGK